MSELTALAQQLALTPWVLVLVFLLCTIDGFFPPIPSESVVIAAAAVIVTVQPSRLFLLCAVSAVGAFLGDNISYLIGRKMQGLRKSRWTKIVSGIDKAEEILARRGAGILMGARFIPVVRVAVNMAAGLTNFPRGRFIGIMAFIDCVWAIQATIIGTAAGAWFRENPLLGAAVGVGIGLLVGYVVDRIFALRNRQVLQKA